MSKQVKQEEQVEEEQVEETESSEEEEVEGSDDQERIPIDLSENEVYRGICTLFEDEDGNNILEYISLLHTELIGIKKSIENLKSIKKDIGRIADCAELFFKMNSVTQDDSRRPSDDKKKVKKVV